MTMKSQANNATYSSNAYSSRMAVESSVEQKQENKNKYNVMPRTNQNISLVNEPQGYQKFLENKMRLQYQTINQPYDDMQVKYLDQKQQYPPELVETMQKLQRQVKLAEKLDGMFENAQKLEYNMHDQVEAQVASAAAWNEVYKMDKTLSRLEKEMEDGPKVSGEMPETYVE